MSSAQHPLEGPLVHGTDLFMWSVLIPGPGPFSIDKGIDFPGMNGLFSQDQMDYSPTDE